MLEHGPDYFYAFELVRMYEDAEVELWLFFGFFGCLVLLVISPIIASVVAGTVVPPGVIGSCSDLFLFDEARIRNHVDTSLEFVHLEEHLANDGEAVVLDSMRQPRIGQYFVPEKVFHKTRFNPLFALFEDFSEPFEELYTVEAQPR